MNSKKFIFFAAIGLIAITGCKKSGAPVPKTVLSQEVDVYVVGETTATNGKTVATYWKNGVSTKLADSTSNSIGKGIAINGDNVYIVGNTTSANGNTAAIIWKNGTGTMLTDGSSQADARAITIDGSDVYVAGFTSLSNGQPIATYWKNGLATSYNGGVYANAIALHNGNIYVAGATVDYSSYYHNYIPACWTNGVATSLSSFISSSYFISGAANGIAFNGSDEYVATDYYAGEYWKNNGSATILSGGQNTYAAAIAINKAEVFIAGYTGAPNGRYIATYWKNNVAISLSNDTSFTSFASSIAINSDDLYIAGDLGPNFSKPSAVYWKNGKAVYLSPNGYATGIAVIPHN